MTGGEKLVKSVDVYKRQFVDCLSMGGNLLLDIGPKEDGSIPEEQIAVLKDVYKRQELYTA